MTRAHANETRVPAAHYGTELTNTKPTTDTKTDTRHPTDTNRNSPPIDGFTRGLLASVTS